MKKPRRGSLPFWRTSSSPARAARDVGACVVDDAIVHVRRRAADAALPDMARPARRGGDGARAGLGHRPGLDQRKAEAPLEILLMARIDAGAEAEAHAVRGLRVLLLELQQDRRHHAEIMDHGRAASP